jgi:hypothetical protein
MAFCEAVLKAGSKLIVVSPLLRRLRIYSAESTVAVLIVEGGREMFLYDRESGSRSSCRFRRQ